MSKHKIQNEGATAGCLAWCAAPPRAGSQAWSWRRGGGWRWGRGRSSSSPRGCGAPSWGGRWPPDLVTWRSLTPDLLQVGVNLPVYPLKGHLVSASPAPGQPMVTRNIYRYIYTIYCDIYTIHCNIYKATVISRLSTVISTYLL